MEFTFISKNFAGDREEFEGSGRISSLSLSIGIGFTLLTVFFPERKLIVTQSKLSLRQSLI
jgi:hypothetical protein